MKQAHNLISQTCECGCGQEVKSGNKFVHGHNRKGKIGFQRFGEDNPNWNGGRYITKQGYVLILKPDHPKAMLGGYVSEHRLVMEEYLGRYLESGEIRGWDEIPHHIDEDKQNNSIENLELCLDKVHKKFHSDLTPPPNWKGKTHTLEARNNMSIARRNRKAKSIKIESISEPDGEGDG